MSDPTHSAPLDRRHPRTGATTAPDPAECGTAYGMELSMSHSGAPGDAPPTAGDAQADPLNWIRRWIDRHAQR
jgi:hypothetical protein